MKRVAEDNVEQKNESTQPMDPNSSSNGNAPDAEVPPAPKRQFSPTPENKEFEKMKLDMADANMEKVAILDFGAQYGKVIDRRVRESKVLSEMMPLATTAAEIQSSGNFKGIIISGGPSSVYAEGAPQIDPEIFTCGLPVLGVCYGFQLMNKLNGGSVTKDPMREDGQTAIEVDSNCLLFSGLGPTEEVLLTHGDSVSPETIAPGFKIVARNKNVVAGIANEERKLYGVQFHPEVDLTVHGKEIFDNFLFKVAGCKGDFTMASREETCIQEIRDIVGKKKVLVMVSGGVDSAVCAALLHKALDAERVTAIHIDTGFMRQDESDSVITSLNALDLAVKRYNCHFDFLNGTIDGIKGQDMLDQTADPEDKRQIIGNTFIRVKDNIMAELKLDPEEYFLAQGTLRPDLIESASALASGHADKIKTHHNDTELVRKLRAEGRVIEPLKDFHKDEVRELGASLGLPEDIVQRQPFPGPGLAIRILCGSKPYKCADFEATHAQLNIIVNLAREPATEKDAEYREKILPIVSSWGMQTLIQQPFEMNATLLPIKSVGVQGDCRSYSYVAALSTNVQPIPWNYLAKYAQIIPKLLHNINRVVYVFGDAVQQPVYNITPTYLNLKTVEKLQKADKIATDVLFAKNSKGEHIEGYKDCGRVVQQMPVVMIPVHFDRDPATEVNSYAHSFVLRPFITSDFMTGVAAVPGLHIPENTVTLMASAIKNKVFGVSRVMIDLTNKPPGTTEWE